MMNEPNPAYVDAPYEMAFAIFVPVPAAVRLWSRKRRLKWIRRKRKKGIAALMGPPPGGCWTQASPLEMWSLATDRQPILPILFKRLKDEDRYDTDYTGERDGN